MLLATHSPQPVSQHQPASAPYLLLAFVDTLADALEVVGALALVGAILTTAGVPGAAWGLVAVLALLTGLLLIQIGASFFCALANLRLAVLGATVSLSLALGVAAELAYVQGWWGWRLLIISAAPVLLVALVLLPLVAITRRHHLTPAHRRFLLVNLLAPTVFIVALVGWQLLAP